MKENMITRFFFYFAHIASIRNPPTPPFESILSQILAQVAFQAKKLTLIGTQEFQTGP